MYSLILMAAMSAGPEVPEFGGVGWDTSLCFLRTCQMPYCAPIHGCFYETCLPTRYGWASSTGCCGGYRYGGCYGVGYGSGCAGCGGCGGCYGSCYSSCYGCGMGHGYVWPGSCTGGIYGLPTSCYGNSCTGCTGTYDPSYHSIGYGSFTGYGNYGAYGSSPVMSPNYSPAIPTPSAKPVMISPQLRNTETIPSQSRLAKAQIILEVPENATVFVDDNRMSSTGSKRVFLTPELEVGQDYYYTVRVVSDKDGKSFEESRKVIVRPGESASLAFSAPASRDSLTSLGR